MGPVQFDPARWPNPCLLNRFLGSILLIFLRKNSKTQSSLNFLQSRPRKLTKSDVSGLAPIQRVLKEAGPQKTGLGSQRFPRILLNLWGSAGRFCGTFHIIKNLLKKGSWGSAELWESNPAFQALQSLLPQKQVLFRRALRRRL